MSQSKVITELAGRVPATEGPPNPVPMTVSIILIAIALAVGLLLIWIVNGGWVLEQLAGVILIANFMLGVVADRFVYKHLLTESVPIWTRMTVAIILGVAVAVSVAELTHSHRLTRDYEHYSSEYDE